MITMTRPPARRSATRPADKHNMNNDKHTNKLMDKL